MNVYMVLSRLLDYPTQELVDNLRMLQKIVSKKMALPPEEEEGVSNFIKWMRRHDLIELQEIYVQTFDMQPEHSLHLTHHLFGDDRGRGPALVDLGEHYKGEGMEVKSGELPDYLPLILEYVSTLDEFAARVFLADAAKVLTVLAANLEHSNSPYAPLVRIIDRHGRLVQTAA
ncbi:MAG: nitrate reductase molybdenum cofactor assembly chaperone [Pseudomonadota bacterium]